MNRKKFLSLISLGTAATALPLCAFNCSVENPDKSLEGNTTVKDVDLKLSLNDSKYSKLKTKGEFLTVEGIVIAYGTDGKYYAVQAICPHEKGNIKHVASEGRFLCDNHPNYFSHEGISDGAYTTINLKTYTVQLTDDILSIKG